MEGYIYTYIYTYLYVHIYIYHTSIMGIWRGIGGNSSPPRQQLNEVRPVRGDLQQGSIYIQICICLYIYIYIYIYIYTYIYIYMCVYIYVYISDDSYGERWAFISFIQENCRKPYMYIYMYSCLFKYMHKYIPYLWVNEIGDVS
jgi:hypothetical protein